MWDYTSSVIDHFSNPRNVGEIPDANGIGEVGSLACGDALKLYLKIDPTTQVIQDAKFKTFGCASAIASASALTELVKGRTVEEALKISNDDIARFLGGLPEQKMHCSVMGQEALEAAVANYRGEKTVEHQDAPVVCKCFWVTEEKIRDIIKEHALTEVEQVTHFTKAGGGCGGCIPDIERILREMNAGASSVQTEERTKPLTNLQRITLISKVIEEEIIPILQRDGGSLELVDINGPTVTVRLQGACRHCAGAAATLRHTVQDTLRKRVSPDLVVEDVK